jgi:hypothetical protein
LVGILVGKPEGKRAHGIPMHHWEDTVISDALKKYSVRIWTESMWLRIEFRVSLL